MGAYNCRNCIIITKTKDNAVNNNEKEVNDEKPAVVDSNKEPGSSSVTDINNDSE